MQERRANTAHRAQGAGGISTRGKHTPHTAGGGQHTAHGKGAHRRGRGGGGGGGGAGVCFIWLHPVFEAVRYGEIQ